MSVKTFAEDILEFITTIKESLTSAVKTIDTDHAYIHDSIMFSTYDQKTLTAGGTTKYSIVTPDTASGTQIHWRPTSITSSGDNVLTTIYEGNSNVTAGGTLTPYNRNRTSSLTSKITFKSSATITTAGTAIDAYFIGGGVTNGGKTSGDTLIGKEEIILAKNKNYSIVIYNGSTASNTVFTKFMWYEENG